MRKLSPLAAVLLVVALIGASQLVPQRDARDSGARDHPTHGCEHASDVPSEDAPEEAEAATLCLLNAERRRHDRPPFRALRSLRRAAAEHAEDMVERGFFAHESPEGVSADVRIVRAGYDRRPAVTGENLAYGESVEGTPAAIV